MWITDDLQLTGWRDPFTFTSNTAAAPSKLCVIAHVVVVISGGFLCSVFTHARAHFARTTTQLRRPVIAWRQFGNARLHAEQSTLWRLLALTEPPILLALPLSFPCAAANGGFTAHGYSHDSPHPTQGLLQLSKSARPSPLFHVQLPTAASPPTATPKKSACSLARASRARAAPRWCTSQPRCCRVGESGHLLGGA